MDMDQDSLRLDVALPSGRCESVQLLVGDSITDLKLAAQETFGQLFLRLSGPNGRLLDPWAGGNSICAVAQQPKVAATSHAFALWCVGVGGNQIVTWGSEFHGDGSAAVRDQIRNVQQIVATESSFKLQFW